jgi:hypothetical protein
MQDVPILLLGFNRPDLLKKRVQEISKMNIRNLYVAIDGDSQSNTVEMLNLVKSIPDYFSNYTNIRVTHQKHNLGLTKHMTESISAILEVHSNVIVVEDDISLSKSFYNNMNLGLSILNSNNTLGTVSSLSALNYSGRIYPKNKWRKTKYFFCWGWGCSRETWAKYRVDLSYVDLDNELSSSSLWKDLSSHQKEVWISRFNRVKNNPTYTWDIQMQYASFLFNFTNLAPVFRFSNNEGFNDMRATHTKNSKPGWLRDDIKNSQILKTSLRSKKINKLVEVLDSIIIANDRSFLK